MEQEQDKVTWKLRFLQIGNTLGNGALNFGKGALNVLSPLALSLPSRTPGANTIAEELAKAHRGVIAGALDKTLWGKAINILDGVGGATLGRTSATETGNFVTDGLNGFVSSMPILSTALAPLGKTIDVYSSDRQKRSQSFNRQSTAMKNNGANVLFNGSALQAEGNLESIRNVQAEQTLKQGDLDNAADALAVWHRQDMKLRGGPNRINNFGVTGGKQGTVLLFTRRTLSKSKIKKHQIGGKVAETSDFVDKVSDKLSRITLDEYLQQKRQAWIGKAIQKASTRNAPYMFKNKDWKNCIATAFDSYGLYDKNGMPLVIRNADFVVDPNRYGFTELPFGDDIDHLPNGVLIQDYNNPKNRNIPGHAIILTGRDENGVPIYSWSSGNNEIEDMHPQARLYSFYWTDKVKPKAYQFIGTPEQINLWIDEYKLMYNLSDTDIEAFKEGGKVNVIPSGALHAHKHNLTKVAEDGEKFEDVTTKGIPVVVEDEKGNLIQQAEVEREEIIFRLEVTKKLEELMNLGTDEAAIEAGKILVYEILENTKDNTGEML